MSQKYVEMRIYTLKPGTVPGYLKVYQELGMEAQREILGHNLGYFYTEVGALNQVIHMWVYNSLEDREARRGKLMKDKRWLEMLPKLREFIVSQETKILIPAPFDPLIADNHS